MSFNFHVYKQDQQNHIQFKHKMNFLHKHFFDIFKSSILTLCNILP